MRKKLFVKKAVSFGYKVDEFETHTDVITNWRNGKRTVVVRIGEKFKHDINIMQGRFMTDSLMDIVFEYSSTQMCDRSGEKKYRLKLLMEQVNRESFYLAKYSKGDSYTLVKTYGSNSYRTVFKESEILLMDTTGFEKMEVF